jgi:hypothetical protein
VKWAIAKQIYRALLNGIDRAKLYNRNPRKSAKIKVKITKETLKKSKIRESVCYENSTCSEEFI